MEGEEDEDDLDEADAAFWQATVDRLLAKGETQAEAIDGANLLLQAVRRHRREMAKDPKTDTRIRESGVRVRTMPLSAGAQPRKLSTSRRSR